MEGEPTTTRRIGKRKLNEINKPVVHAQPSPSPPPPPQQAAPALPPIRAPSITQINERLAQTLVPLTNSDIAADPKLFQKILNASSNINEEEKKKFVETGGLDFIIQRALGLEYGVRAAIVLDTYFAEYPLAHAQLSLYSTFLMGIVAVPRPLEQKEYVIRAVRKFFESLNTETWSFIHKWCSPHETWKELLVAYAKNEIPKRHTHMICDYARLMIAFGKYARFHLMNTEIKPLCDILVELSTSDHSEVIAYTLAAFAELLQHPSHKQAGSKFLNRQDLRQALLIQNVMHWKSSALTERLAKVCAGMGIKMPLPENGPSAWPGALLDRFFPASLFTGSRDPPITSGIVSRAPTEVFDQLLRDYGCGEPGADPVLGALVLSECPAHAHGFIEHERLRLVILKAASYPLNMNYLRQLHASVFYDNSSSDNNNNNTNNNQEGHQFFAPENALTNSALSSGFHEGMFAYILHRAEECITNWKRGGVKSTPKKKGGGGNNSGNNNNSGASAPHPLKVAAALHWAVSLIHGFEDGNGRIARALALAVLCRAGLVPVCFPDATGYYLASSERSFKHTYDMFVDGFTQMAFVSTWTQRIRRNDTPTEKAAAKAEAQKEAGNAAFKAERYSDALKEYKQGSEFAPLHLLLHTNIAVTNIRLASKQSLSEAVKHCGVVVLLCEILKGEKQLDNNTNNTLNNNNNNNIASELKARMLMANTLLRLNRLRDTQRAICAILRRCADPAVAGSYPAAGSMAAEARKLRTKCDAAISALLSSNVVSDNPGENFESDVSKAFATREGRELINIGSATDFCDTHPADAKTHRTITNTFSPDPHERAGHFVRRVRPSFAFGKPWIQLVHNETIPPIPQGFDAAAQDAVSRYLLSGPDALKGRLEKVAKEYNWLYGKWVIIRGRDEVDETWERVGVALCSGQLPYGVSAKVATVTEALQYASAGATAKDGGATTAGISDGQEDKETLSFVIVVYNNNFLEEEQVMALRRALTQVGAAKENEVLNYKPDVYTATGYAGLLLSEFLYSV